MKNMIHTIVRNAIIGLKEYVQTGNVNIVVKDRNIRDENGKDWFDMSEMQQA